MPSFTSSPSRSPLLVQRLAGSQIIYLLVVIVFGAFVRASGSGAGCGSHWPLCNGEIIPRAPQWQTLIELTHRLTSGLTLPLALLVLWHTWRHFGAGQRARKAAFATVCLVISEGLVGAGLVLFEHVAENRSAYRGFSMGLHLVNTFALVATATALWYWTRYPQVGTWRRDGSLRRYLALGLALLIALGVSGAITALGDTLFPVQNVGDAWRLGLSPSEHVFVRLRVWHPFIAVAVGAYLVFTARWVAARFTHTRQAALLLSSLVLTQLVLGYLNVYLMAPIWLQLVHLLTAETIWIVFIYFAVHALTLHNPSIDAA